MNTLVLLVVLLGLSTLAFYLGRKRAFSVVRGRVRDLHSLPAYYGFQAALWCGLPALLLFGLWVSFESTIIMQYVIEGLPDELRNLPQDRLGLLVNDLRNLVEGNIVSGEVSPAMQVAADHYSQMQNLSNLALTVVVLAIAIMGAAFALKMVRREQRARNQVEKAVMFFLISSSSIAIFSTIGIVLSVLFESIRFFQQIPVTDFIFGLEWSPQTAIRADQVGSTGAFGAIPLFAGTLMVTFIAMLVAVPIG
ncbi:MAG: phosphate ABC transporter permease family protein, partial [Pseudomonadota bacterium]